MGAVRPDDAGAEASPGGAGAAVFETQFAANDGIWTERVVLPGGDIEFGVERSDATDHSVAVLRFPGSEEAEPTDSAGPDYVTQIQTVERFPFGTFRTSVEFGTCEPGEEVVSALLGYFGDGSDLDDDSLTDELEIDWQVPCGTPELSFLTVFTDYEVDDSGNEAFRKLTRAIDFSTGDAYDTPSASSDALVLSGNQPTMLHPGFPVPGTFYELGFEWHADLVRFFIVLDGAEQTVWVLSDPTHIPQQPLHFMYNLWHPESHWEPASGVADFPANDVPLAVDWLRISGQ